jgi:ribosomal protein S18 acetylase RimI-like enzyme
LSVGVRRLGREDAVLAAEIVRRVKETNGGPGIGADLLRRFLGKPENVLIVAEEDGVPAGFLVAYALDRIDRDRRMVCLYEIGVVSRKRRRGIGRAMIDALLSWCRAQGAMKTWVITDRSNESAMRLYARTGARPDAGQDVVFVWTGED